VRLLASAHSMPRVAWLSRVVVSSSSSETCKHEPCAVGEGERGRNSSLGPRRLGERRAEVRREDSLGGMASGVPRGGVPRHLQPEETEEAVRASEPPAQRALSEGDGGNVLAARGESEARDGRLVALYDVRCSARVQPASSVSERWSAHVRTGAQAHRRTGAQAHGPCWGVASIYL
jgi:hypothetical protein